MQPDAEMPDDPVAFARYWLEGDRVYRLINDNRAREIARTPDLRSVKEIEREHRAVEVAELAQIVGKEKLTRLEFARLHAAAIGFLWDIETGGKMYGGAPMPPWLARFVTDVLTGKRTRPARQAGRDRMRNANRDMKLWQTVHAVHRRFSLPFNHGDGVSEKTTAVSVVAEASGLSNQAVAIVWRCGNREISPKFLEWGLAGLRIDGQFSDLNKDG